MNFPSWDLIIIVGFIIGVSYGFILKREKVLSILASVYISYLVTLTWGQTLTDFFQGKKLIFNQIWIKSDTSSFTVNVSLFLILLLLLSGFTSFAATKTKMSGLGVLLQSFLSVALSSSVIISFIDDNNKAKLFESSQLAGLIWQYHSLWIMAPVLILIFMGIRYGDN